MNKNITVCDRCNERIAKCKCELCEEDVCDDCMNSLGISLIEGDFEFDEDGSYEDNCDFYNEDGDDECDGDCKNCEHYDEDEDTTNDCECMGIIAPMKVCNRCHETISKMKVARLNKNNGIKDMVLPMLKKYIILDKLKPNKKVKK